MKKGELVAVAMSGGVDSSVAALLLKKQGFSVIGITMKLIGDKKNEAARAARRVCTELNITHHVVNFSQSFKKCVIDNFVKKYQQGLTPNPCVICNEKIKFDLLLNYARQLGARHLATGHYVRLKTNKNNGYELFIGEDKNKDQSYFLYRLRQEQLKYLFFPLGDLTKNQVRQIAQKNKLFTAKREESQEICFVPDDNYRQFLLNNGLINKPGKIINKNKKIIGYHHGLFNYTIGQRKGLGISNPRPLYVVKIDIKKNQLVTGEDKELLSDKCLVKNVSWVNGKPPKKNSKITAKIRYHSLATRVNIKKDGVNYICYFVKKQRAITPGQSIVFYQGQRLLGGGIINRSY
ncbi:MAG: tRNA 2-thiouridine(34) synthase MnmA [Patescibacteria group bacterium]|nr:tRNA 2-thiouridine(34) synthase MnmA [Patescibacteria group bacterium]MDD5121174.1 tRNA 2-thiouridine(34) synthase MnmA [Patescibacteria group bacterium]MDD5222016.1 tRNA 2-thiouridine(34) synthase MnmA [Patescibacteria group bacterium]MDD5395907.1 tRNA 2-thiouridine(34) synthase MnmA [Patescibacteria group bacterium]